MTRHERKRYGDNLGLVRRRAMTLVESVVSIAIVGLMFAAVLNTVGAAAVTRQHATEQARAVLLADDLLAEILRQGYAEPGDADSFGRELPESNGVRSAYDDVDDYDGWSSSPPEEKDGTAIPGLTGWTRSVDVDFVNSGDLASITASDTGVKRITVIVTGPDAATAKLVAIRTAAGTAKEAE